ncbi:hypothetical protein JIC86_001672 [Acinetobacter baumannii]|nr:hypothetical protein [Acinetobacter baumannii]
MLWHPCFMPFSKSEEQPVMIKKLTPTTPIKILFIIVLSSDLIMELRLFLGNTKPCHGVSHMTFFKVKFLDEKN